MMKKLFLLSIIVICFSCHKEEKKPLNSSFLIGTYTNGESKGIYKSAIDAEGKFKDVSFEALTDNPSFLAYTKNKDYVVAVNESDPGSISSFKVENDSLILIDKISSHGSIPCHVTITDDNYIITSNYMGGNVVLSKIDSNGKLTFLDSKKHEGKTDHPRQEMAHVHSTWIHPETGDLIAVDLGTNDLWFYEIDASVNKLVPKSQQKLAMMKGAGPRHLTFHPINKKWMYVLNELNASVSLVVYKDEKYQLISTANIMIDNYSEYNASADIHISNDGNFLYASNRGYNSIAVSKINQNDGSLDLVEIQKIPGSWPRNFSFNPNGEYIIYANKWTNNLFSLKRDTQKGTFQVVDSIQVPNPVMILF